MARTTHDNEERRNWTPASAGVVLAALLASPALAQDNGHTGVAIPRTAPELSDFALFVMAAVGVWFTRRALGKRTRKD